MRAAPWLLPVLWMAVISLLGSDMASAGQTKRLLLPVLAALVPSASPAELEVVHATLRKLGHFVEYAILAALWVRAFRLAGRWPAARAAIVALTLSVGWALLDEARQSLVASRTASLADVGLDAAGAATAAAIGLGWTVATSRLTGAFLWTAAVGGGAMLVVNALAGVPSGILWATVSLAAVALALRRTLRSRATPPPAAPSSPRYEPGSRHPDP